MKRLFERSAAMIPTMMAPTTTTCAGDCAIRKLVGSGASKMMSAVSGVTTAVASMTKR